MQTADIQQSKFAKFLRIIKKQKMQTAIKELMAKKDEMEKQIASLSLEISALNESKGYDKSLVDHQGFPKENLDFGELSAYRVMKRRKAELNNDHVALMKEIEKALFAIHAEYRENKMVTEQLDPQKVTFRKGSETTFKGETAPKDVEIKEKVETKIDYLTPFAIVSMVTDNSPAFQGGIRTGDLLSEFHEVNIYSMNAIKEIPRQVRQGIEITIVILRETDEPVSEKENIFLLNNEKNYRKIICKMVPKIWEGAGLLGCKIDPLVKP